MTWHILYVSYEEDGRDYVGAHSTGDLYDGYLGSYKDKTFQPDDKIIIGYYKTREALLKAEENLQKSLDVAKNPQYANRSIQTSTGFNRKGVPDTPETRERKSKGHTGKKRSESHIQSMVEAQNRPEVVQKKSEAMKGDNNPSKRPKVRQKLSELLAGEKNPMYGKPSPMRGVTGENHPMYGATHTEDHKNHMSDLHSGQGNPCYGKRWWVNEQNETVYQENSPGTEWQRGRKWKTIK